MRNRILYLTRNTIPYVKELQPLAYSVAGCILMQQLDYWFERYPNGFYKFMEPSEHPRYKTGESWCEELGMSADEFRTAFDKIGTRHKSKSQFEQATDKFQGKFYCSYLDRRTNLTYYFRNHPHLDKALDALIVVDNTPPGPAEGGQPIGNSPTSPSVTNGIQEGFTVKPIPPVTVNRESLVTVKQERQDTGNGQQPDTGKQISPNTQMDIPGLQETGKVHVVNTEITGSEITQKPQQQPLSTLDNRTDTVTLEVSCCGNPDLVFPKTLHPEEREEIGNMLRGCPEEHRQQVLDEIEGAIRARTIQKGVIPFCRALVRAVQMGSFTANLGVSVLAKRHADDAHVERITRSTALEVEEAALVKGNALMEQISNRRKTRDGQNGQLTH